MCIFLKKSYSTKLTEGSFCYLLCHLLYLLHRGKAELCHVVVGAAAHEAHTHALGNAEGEMHEQTVEQRTKITITVD